MKTITIFSFGYYGWGSSTPRLVEAVDAIEAKRGFRPPIFVDVRISRVVRATGFNGAAFEKVVGKARYRWMKDLGNKKILTRTGPAVQIADPKAVEDLLALAVEAAREKRRVVFFCGCPWPRFDGKISCHRTTVGTLLLAAARRKAVPIELVEWPGGKPERLTFEVSPAVFRAVQNKRMSVPAAGETEPADVEGPPWGSIATFKCEGKKIYRVMGPMMWKSGWCHQVFRYYDDPDVPLQLYQRESAQALKLYGLDPRRTAR